MHVGRNIYVYFSVVSLSYQELFFSLANGTQRRRVSWEWRTYPVFFLRSLTLFRSFTKQCVLIVFWRLITKTHQHICIHSRWTANRSHPNHHRTKQSSKINGLTWNGIIYQYKRRLSNHPPPSVVCVLWTRAREKEREDEKSIPQNIATCAFISASDQPKQSDER